MGTGTVYRIVVSSELSERYAPAFEGMEMEAKSGRTILTGEIVDQAHLYGILNRIARLGLQLMSVESGFPEHQGHAANRPSAGDRETWRGLDS
jgi:hypothetical protein